MEFVFASNNLNNGKKLWKPANSCMEHALEEPDTRRASFFCNSMTTLLRIGIVCFVSFLPVPVHLAESLRADCAYHLSSYILAVIKNCIALWKCQGSMFTHTENTFMKRNQRCASVEPLKKVSVCFISICDLIVYLRQYS